MKLKAMNKIIGPLLLWVFLMITGLLTVYTKHQNRLLITELEQQRQYGYELQEKAGRYLLERSALSSYSLVEIEARNQLNMHIPNEQEVIILEVN